jgi:hypothetical protein
VTGLLVVLGAGLGAVSILAFVSSQRRRAALRGREPLSVDEVFSRYFADRGFEKEAVMRHWHACADRLRLPAQLLRPSDRFDQELKSLRWLDPFDDRKDDLARYALGEAKKHQGTLDLESVRTLGDLVVALVRLDEEASGRSAV